MKKGNAGVIVVVIMFVLMIGGIAAYLILHKTTTDPIVELSELVVPTSIDLITGKPVESFVVLEDVNNTIRKEGKVPIDSALSFTIPQMTTYKLHFTSEGHYSINHHKSMGNVPVEMLDNQTMQPFCKNISLKQNTEFKVGENEVDFSLVCNDGYLRKAGVCIAWSPSFIYADISPIEVPCGSMWKQQPNGFYNCDYPEQAAVGVNCNSLKNSNYTCTLANMLKPERLKNKVDFCSNFEYTLEPWQEYNFTVNYKLLESPTVNDYLRMVLIDKDEVLDSNNHWVVTNSNPINEADVGAMDTYREIPYQTQAMLDWAG